MKQYYKAYEDRYKKVHKTTGLAWAGDEPSIILKDLFEKYSINTSSNILEIGCGEGQNAIFLLNENYNIVASDVSPAAIKWCKTKANQAGILKNRFFVLDIVKNKHKRTYDCIYSISTLHMLVLDSDRKAFFDFIYNHLNTNGIAIVTSMGDGEFEKNTSDITKAFELNEREFNNQIINVASTTCRIVNWENILAEVKNSNLQIVDKFVSTKISGFNVSMVLILKKNN